MRMHHKFVILFIKPKVFRLYHFLLMASDTSPTQFPSAEFCLSLLQAFSATLPILALIFSCMLITLPQPTYKLLEVLESLSHLVTQEVVHRPIHDHLFIDIYTNRRWSLLKGLNSRRLVLYVEPPWPSNERTVCFAAIILLLSLYKWMSEGATPHIHHLGKPELMIWIRCQRNTTGHPRGETAQGRGKEAG